MGARRGDMDLDVPSFALYTHFFIVPSLVVTDTICSAVAGNTVKPWYDSGMLNRDSQRHYILAPVNRSS